MNGQKTNQENLRDKFFCQTERAEISLNASTPFTSKELIKCNEAIMKEGYILSWYYEF